MKPGQLLSLALRESRFARGRLFLFLSAITLGVAALVALQGFSTNLQREIRNQARAMLGADLQLASNDAFGPRSEETLEAIAAEGYAVARLTSFSSMALHADTGGTRLVQVRAPEPGYPFYGTIETQPAGQWSLLHEDRNAVVDPALLVALGAEIGDSIAIGETRFRVIAELRRLPGDLEVASSFAPRVFIPAAYVDETQLLGFGSRGSYEAFVRVPDPALAESIQETYRPLWREEGVRSRTLDEQQQQLEQLFGSLARYLGLVGVFALLLGGIGVASAMSAYMARKVDHVAVLRCLGATSRQVFGIYLLQAAMMGLVGAAVGVAVGSAVQWLLPKMLEGLLPMDVEIRLDGTVAATGLLVGVWAAVAFVLLPLLQVRSVSPLSALRRRVEPLPVSGRGLLQYAAWAVLIVSVLLLIVYQTQRLVAGAVVAAGIGVTLLVLWLAAGAATRLLRRSPRGGVPYPVRLGVSNLHRPGNQTRTVVLALGFGVFLIATLILTQANILRPLMVDADTRFNLVFLDVQADQVGSVRRILGDSGLEVLQSVPLVSMRIAALNGERVGRYGRTAGENGAATGSGFDAAERDGDAMVDAERSGAAQPDVQQRSGAAQADGQPPRGWAIAREYRSTYREALTESETLVAGAWWNGEPSANADGPFRVSLEADLARTLGVAVGDRIDWDVQGVVVPTVVAALREVDWARLEPNFFAVFEPAALQAAPQMWVLLARGEDAAARAIAQRDVVMDHSNVTAIDLTQAQQALDDVIGRVSFVMRFLAAFSVATGFIVLLGSVATGRLQRIRDSVLLKTLGATRRQIGVVLLTEYALLGVLAVVVGVGLSLAAGWALARFQFEVPFVAAPIPLVGLAAAIAALSAVVGASGSRDVFRSTPMEALREE